MATRDFRHAEVRHSLVSLSGCASLDDMSTRGRNASDGASRRADGALIVTDTAYRAIITAFILCWKHRDLCRDGA